MFATDMPRALITLLLMMALFAVPTTATARTPEALVAMVPVEVKEIQSGGVWEDRGTSGIYRMVATLAGADRDYAARVHLQWLSIDQVSGQLRVVNTVEIKEFNEQRMPFVSISFDADTPGELNLVLMSRDGVRMRDVVVTIRAGKPGHYAVIDKTGG